MTINFTQYWPERVDPSRSRTLFPERLYKCFTEYYGSNPDYFRRYVDYCIEKGIVDNYLELIDTALLCHPKLHTIRAGNRWAAGKDIHFKIWKGEPYKSTTLALLPKKKCIGVQDIVIDHSKSNPGAVRVYIDGKVFYEGLSYSRVLNPEMNLLAANDGFDSVE